MLIIGLLRTISLIFESPASIEPISGMKLRVALLIEMVFFLKFQNKIKFDIKNFILNTNLIHKNDIDMIYVPLINFFK